MHKAVHFEILWLMVANFSYRYSCKRSQLINKSVISYCFSNCPCATITLCSIIYPPPVIVYFLATLTFVGKRVTLATAAVNVLFRVLNIIVRMDHFPWKKDFRRYSQSLRTWNRSISVPHSALRKCWILPWFLCSRFHSCKQCWEVCTAGMRTLAGSSLKRSMLFGFWGKPQDFCMCENIAVHPAWVSKLTEASGACWPHTSVLNLTVESLVFFRVVNLSEILQNLK